MRVRMHGRSCDVVFEDNERVDSISRDDIRLVEDESASVAKLQVNQMVDAKKQRKIMFYPGRIVRARENGTYDVRYKTGELEYHVERRLIRVSGEIESAFTCLRGKVLDSIPCHSLLLAFVGLEHIEERLRTDDDHLMSVDDGIQYPVYVML